MRQDRGAYRVTQPPRRAHMISVMMSQHDTGRLPPQRRLLIENLE